MNPVCITPLLATRPKGRNKIAKGRKNTKGSNKIHKGRKEIAKGRKEISKGSKKKDRKLRAEKIVRAEKKYLRAAKNRTRRDVSCAKPHEVARVLQRRWRDGRCASRVSAPKSSRLAMLRENSEAAAACVMVSVPCPDPLWATV